MAMKLHSQLEMKLPSSFPPEIYRKVAMTHYPTDGKREHFAGSRVQIDIGGSVAPNYFLIPKYTSVCATVKALMTYNASASATYKEVSLKKSAAIKFGAPFIKSHEEMVNGGSLRLSSSTDPVGTPFLYGGRLLASAYSATQSSDPDQTDNTPSNADSRYINPETFSINGLEMAGGASRERRFHALTHTATDSTQDLAGFNYRIPVAAFSSLCSSDQLIPVPLLSSSGSPGLSLVFNFADVGSAFSTGLAGGTLSNMIVHDFRVESQWCQILDDSVMGLVQQLYQCRLTAPSGGGQEVPVRLQLSYLAFRTYHDSIPAGTRSHTLRYSISTPSAKGIMLRFGKTPPQVGTYLVDYDVYFKSVSIRSSGDVYPLYPATDSYRPGNNVMPFKSWQYHEYMKAKHLFDIEQNNDARLSKENPLSSFFTSTQVLTDTSVNALYLSFENLPHSEETPSELSSARGISTLATGHFDILVEVDEMTIATGPPADATASLTPENKGIETAALDVYSMIVYDGVLDVSSSGVREVENAVLA
jgi:hypothetical protein